LPPASGLRLQLGRADPGAGASSCRRSPRRRTSAANAWSSCRPPCRRTRGAAAAAHPGGKPLRRNAWIGPVRKTLSESTRPGL